MMDIYGREVENAVATLTRKISASTSRPFRSCPFVRFVFIFLLCVSQG
jgi:hypothetical protein